MKYTNHLNLPEAICDSVKNDGYSSGGADISVTGLLKPPKISILEKEHDDDITEDVSDRIFSLLGQSIHTILERANRVAVAERRLSIDCEGWVVSGGMDVYQDNGTLIDYKVTSVWKVIKGDLEEWEQQLNLYSVILRHHGHKVEKLQVVCILRDWSKREAERSPDYPQAQIVNIDIPVWGEEKARSFMRERVILHKMARLQPLSALPDCTPKDRWASSDVWAVMKIGRKSAMPGGLHTIEAEAIKHAATDKALYVQHRKGQSVRCKSYCRVAKFCTQWQTEQTDISLEDST